MSEWISVEDRLPFTDELVLAIVGKAPFVAIYCRDGEHEGEPYDELDVGSWSEDEEHWYWPEGWYEQQINWEDYRYIQVMESGKPTHWMPLPEPPE